MDLYKAMETAQNRVISKDHITSYDTHIVQYLKGVSHLYRDFAMKPIHHMAQHLGEFMLRMGPVHAYRIPAFERLNYLMQQENTNLKIGELEATFLHTTSKVSHLRALLKEDDMVHKEAKDLVDAYLAMESESRRNIGILSDEPGPPPVSMAVVKPCFLDPDTLKALDKFTGVTPIYVNDSFEDVESIVVNGVEYRSAKYHLRGSFILYTSTEGEERPAQIMQLFRHPRAPTTTYIALKCFEPADLPAHVLDPYRRFDIGFLASIRQEEAIVVTSSSNITCPFVNTKVSVGGVDLIHVFPYSRVDAPAFLNP
ncbi:uncharacterized protein ARMOST_15243 [Armillaria ostoyae]|uniref:Uncharacterized protein n=1 Tax=Armillaria ostoyae TaxID=47428 RepID=A0A284RSV3_ARMOS|nr:uncharacterized protein ARMOST_15243 [Armillaria ostoyae]